ncbi:hypothetical protein LCGC14_2396320 [marine sediment metagenome]|uniref:Uncharacterized protein n=1 Tax=marine sediment metagenome TaxID=412755 RepID=A0A0F9BWN8_9ZZZZ
MKVGFEIRNLNPTSQNRNLKTGIGDMKMMLRITTHDTTPDDKEWAETWKPYLTDRVARVYQALRDADDDEVDSSVLARGVSMSTNAFERAIERLKVVGLLKVDDET